MYYCDLKVPRRQSKWNIIKTDRKSEQAHKSHTPGALFDNATHNNEWQGMHKIHKIIWKRA